VDSRVLNEVVERVGRLRCFVAAFQDFNICAEIYFLVSFKEARQREPIYRPPSA